MADDSTNGTIDQHLEENGSPGTLRTLRRVRRAKDSQSNPTNLPTGSQLWENANAAITSRHQQPLPQQQPTREQRTSAAEQELVLTAASLRRSAAARARLNGDTDDRSANDDSNGIDDDNTGSNDDNTGSNGTFNCCNSLRNAGGHSAIQPVSSDIIDYRFRWRIHRMQDHYLTTPVSSPPCYCYGLRIRSSKPSPSQ